MIGLIGSGSWATAVAKILLEQEIEPLYWWVREPEIRESLASDGINCLYLREAEFDPSQLHLTDDINEVLSNCEYVYLVVPTAYLHKALSGADPALLRSRNLISAIKGFVPECDEIVTDYLQHTFQVPENQLAIISGPTHAEDVARENLTFITCASLNNRLAQTVQEQMQCQYINASISDDIRGIQYATALKNIYAVAAGIVRGIGCGDNLMAVLVSFAIAEMAECMQAIEPKRIRQLRPVDTPPYLGDLLVTCYSQYSRNRTFGTMIGRGYSVKSALLEMTMVPEGYYAARSMEKIRIIYNLDLPIANFVYKVLYENAKPEVVIRAWQMSLHGGEGTPFLNPGRKRPKRPHRELWISRFKI
ncbi:MAG: glycerol-3-phosphate dehydrogenase [Bacteroidales bacterium]|nr:glycerol-3-phosphate dehydrogenase [Bacteroidales bacterium]